MTKTASLASVIPVGEPPSEIMLFPAGEARTRPSDAREGWVNDDPEGVVARSSALGDLPIDYEHQSERSEKNGQPAPAAGWITRLFVRDGAIWGAVTWTDKAAAMIRAGEYRYLSPSFLHDKDTRQLHMIIGAGLVNSPALTMKALARATDTYNQEASMDVEKLKDALGLKKAAGEDDILKAVAAAVSAGETAATDLKAVAAAAGLGEDAGVAQITKAVAARVGKPATDPDPAAYVPREEYDKALARVNAIEGERAEEKATAAVDAAVTAGKVSPAQRDWAIAYARKDRDGFDKFVEAAPVILTGGTRAQPATAGSRPAFTAPDGRGVDADRLAIHEKALARAAADKIPYEQAAIIEERAAS